MHDLIVRAAENLADRLTGPLRFRFVLQPLIASALAFGDGLRDAKQGQPPYLWALISGQAPRRDLIARGWASVGKVFAVAVVLDLAYQLFVLHSVYVGETLVVACGLAIVPYLVVRGPVTRLARRSRARR